METQLLNLLKARKATRAIAGREVEPDKVEALFKAARLSASCANKQPWRFLVLTEPAGLEKGREALSGGNYWAKTAPVLLVGFSRPDLDCVPPDGREYFLFDLGMAVQNIMLQATELDLVARPMAGFIPARIHEAFGIPEEYTILVVIAVGYRGDLETLNEKHREVSTAPRVRNPLEKNFFFNEYQDPGGA